jgi:hypothetical protein
MVGFEPTMFVPKTKVLPLHHILFYYNYYNIPNKGIPEVFNNNTSLLVNKP